MTLVVLLFVAGVVLIAAEVFLPGGILGVFGAASIVGGIVAAYSEFGSQGAFIASAVAIALLVLVLVIEFKVLPKTKLGQRLFLKKSVQASVEYSKAGDDAIGKLGETITALSPTGFVMLEGVKMEAASKSGFIEKNERVKVIGKDNFRILVSKI